MADLMSAGDPYLYYLITGNMALTFFVFRELRKQCNLLTKIKTALVMKFPDLQKVLN